MDHYGPDSQDDTGIQVFGIDEVKLLVKNKHFEGFTVADIGEIDPLKQSFIDDTRKIVIDNSAPYGHVTTTWLYLLLSELKKIDSSVVIIFYKRPNTRHLKLEHSSNLTEYLEDRLTQKGHTVRYIDSGDTHLESEEVYINNFTTFLMPINVNTAHIDIVSDFFSEDLDYSKPPTEKIYISRAKTTAYNGNQQIILPENSDLPPDELSELRTIYMYQFSDRIDDERELEEYLKTLGFVIVYPEDIHSYKDQLQLFASSKIVMSLTSSSLSVCTAMAPETFVVELVSPMYTEVDSNGALILESEQFHDGYKNLSLLRNNLYMSISNRYKKASIVINSIESNPALKAFLSS